MKQLILTTLEELIRLVPVNSAPIPFKRYAMAAALGVCAALSGLLAFLCLLAALWQYAEPTVGRARASLVVAGVLVLLAMALILLARYTSRGKRVAPPLQIAPPPPILEFGRSPRTNLSRLASVAIAGFLMGLLRDRRPGQR